MTELPIRHRPKRALIVGSGGFWAAWSLSVPFFADGNAVVPWKQWRSHGWGWMRPGLAAYCRRAAKVLGWNLPVVFVVLGGLLAADLALAIFVLPKAASG